MGDMVRLRKKELFEYVTFFENTNRSVSKGRSGQINIVEVLTQCQNKAIELGNYLETIEEDTTKMVKILEEYCENIYQISTLLSDEEKCRKIFKKIQKQIIQLNHAIEYDLKPDKKEVVFLPYKASMWDSLESVWQAAIADGNTDTYVIPIPYYDKRPDGSFQQMHYEGNDYPEYVPITHYENYDFKNRKPDAIYIHNPYDDNNFVTSVHPFFFASNLKKFTDNLVYIPYFILDEVSPTDTEKIEKIKHFCSVPGVFHANKVIVQSEEMKKIYVQVLLDVTKDSSEAAKLYWEKKIVGLGSPKIDKVMRTQHQEYMLPKQWLEIIQKPDGSWKKIIFYNTSIGALLTNNDEMIKKMEIVFSTFYKNRDEVALLWRPHPLIESTLTSMRPQLWNVYKVLRERYIQEGWGIYDDTADLDRAIAISDAYYGDASSVVQLYQRTGKPIMLQNTGF